MNTPAIIKYPGDPLPELAPGESRYVIAQNGVYRERREEMFTTSARVDLRDLSLEFHQNACDLHCGKLPRVMHRAMLTFFKYAHEVHGGEVALVLLYHPQRRAFRWHCPRQTVEVFQSGSYWVAADYIHFDIPLELPEGFLHMGDAHLHPGPPNPSAMDVADDQDGLHIIVGNINTTPQYHVAFVMDGTRFRLPPEAIFEDVDCRPFERPPNRWLRQIELVRVLPKWQSQQTTYVNQSSTWRR